MIDLAIGNAHELPWWILSTFCHAYDLAVYLFSDPGENNGRIRTGRIRLSHSLLTVFVFHPRDVQPLYGYPIHCRSNGLYDHIPLVQRICESGCLDLRNGQ